MFQEKIAQPNPTPNGGDNSGWTGAMWGTRGLIIFELWCVWRLHGDLVLPQWLVAALVFVALLLFQNIARRQALGWYVDEQGERQKVLSKVRGRPIYEPTTYRARLLREVELRDHRHRVLMLMTPLAAGAVWLVLKLYRYTHHHRHVGFEVHGALAITAFFGAIILLAWAWNVLVEVAYQAGIEDLDGHKVVDPEPLAPGMKTVERQKAYGDGGVADEAEAIRQLRRGS